MLSLGLRFEGSQSVNVFQSAILESPGADQNCSLFPEHAVPPEREMSKTLIAKQRNSGDTRCSDYGCRIAIALKTPPLKTPQ
jgi:hypothetical protein